ncbi:MAG: AsmA family protein [Candidatus Omnitrophica bacterium]|nr:AsmA family protein [Candidatus Omnitrophota bacterium]
MPRLKKIVRSLFILSCVLTVSFGIFITTAFPPSLIRSEVTKNIRETTGGELKAGEYRLLYFPSLQIEIKKAEWFFPQDNATSLKADNVRIGLNLWELLRKNIRISRFQVENASLETPRLYPVLQKICAGCFVPTLRLQGLGMDFKFRQGRRVLDFQIKSAKQEGRRYLQGRGSLRAKNPLDSLWHLKDRHLQSTFEIKDLPLEFLQQTISGRQGFRLKSGNLTGRAAFIKRLGQDLLSLQMDLKFQEMAYEVRHRETFVPVPPLSFEISADATWDFSSEEFSLKPMRILSPLGELHFAGGFRAAQRQFKEMRVTGTGIALEALPLIWPEMKKAIPINVGFSGKSNFQGVLEGPLEGSLTWHGHWDMGSMNLNYSRYFSKPKDMPMSLNMEFLFEKGEKLSGSFSIRMAEIVMKGTLTDVNLGISKGDVNLLTNKFALKGREPLFPFLEKYALDGQTKFLAHWHGRLFDPESSQVVITLILENGSFLREDGTGPRNMSFYLDYSPMALEIRKGGVELGESKVLLKARVRRLPDKPAIKAQIQSPHFIPETFFEEFDLLLFGRLNENQRGYYQKVKQALGSLFPDRKALEDLKMEVNYKDGKWLIDSMDFDAYDGKARFKGEMDFTAPEPLYKVGGEIDRWSLARLLEGGKWQDLITGNLFLKGSLEGFGFDPEGWEERVKAEGRFSITQGELASIDLLGALADIPKFSYLKNLESKDSKTPFDDIQASFKWAEEDGVKDEEQINKKFITRNLVLLSDDLYVEGEGDVLREGILNYRFNVYLPPMRMEETLASLIVQIKREGEKRLGPIPFLLSGPLSQPELKPDPALLPQILEEIEKKKIQKIFRNFLPEETFLDRRSSS